MLRFENTKDLTFKHTPEGVVVLYKKHKLVLGYLSFSQPGVVFSDEQYLSMANAVLELHCSLRNYPKHEVTEYLSVPHMPKESNFSPFSKYISNNIFEKYIKKGIWQLGTVEQYKTIENIKQRDEFEGHSFVNLNINDHLVSVISSAGYNYLVFCGTRDSSSEKHKSQFGEKELYFPNVRSFAESVQRSIGAKHYFIQNVQYNSLKLYVDKTPILNSRIDVDQPLTVDFFEELKKHFLYPSLFVKPEPFKEEREVRIVFEMPKDYRKPCRFENKSLLNYVEVR